MVGFLFFQREIFVQELGIERRYASTSAVINVFSVVADLFDGAVSTTLSYFRKEIARLDFRKMTAKKV